MRFSIAILHIIAAAPLLAAPPTLTLPAEVTGEPGAFIVVRAESDSPWVNFRADSGLAVFPANLLADRKATVVTARAAGRYTLHAYSGSVDGGVDAVVTVVVGDAPLPPQPKPEPEPEPRPVPPQPGHPLAQFRTNPIAPEVGAATLAFADVLKANPVGTLGEFKAKLTEFYALAFASTPNAMPGFSVALEAAFVAAFGKDDGPLVLAKADAFLKSAAAALGVN